MRRFVRITGCVSALVLGLTACGGGQAGDGSSGSPSNGPATNRPSSTSPATNRPSSTSPAATGSPSSGSPSHGPVSRKEAGTIVTDKYGGHVIGVEADTEKGRKTWEVEVRDSRKGRIEVDVTRDGGKMISFERD